MEDRFRLSCPRVIVIKDSYEGSSLVGRQIYTELKGELR